MTNFFITFSFAWQNGSPDWGNAIASSGTTLKEGAIFILLYHVR
ncbi:hypothetical protein [Nostoc sp.]